MVNPNPNPKGLNLDWIFIADPPKTLKIKILTLLLFHSESMYASDDFLTTAASWIPLPQLSFQQLGESGTHFQQPLLED